MKTKLKICGIQSEEIAELCEKLAVDFVGLNFFEGSKRYLPPDRAVKIRSQLKKTKAVGIFVDAPLKFVNEISTALNLDFVQLHGKETVEYCEQILKPIIKAFSVQNKGDLDRSVVYKKYVQYYLFDSKVEGQAGGTGKEFNWEILKDYQTDHLYFLTGGIDESNILEAIKVAKPYAIDIASGAEKEGKKDQQKIKKLVSIISSA